LVILMPFIAYCASCGVLVLADLLNRTADKRWRVLAILGWGSILAVALSAFVMALPNHSLKGSLQYISHSLFWRELALTWFMYVPYALLLFLVPKISIPLKGRPGAFALTVGALALVIGLQFSLFPDKRIAKSQFQKLSRATDPELNKVLYAAESKGILKGKITTDYLTLEQLPQLRKYFQSGELFAPPSIAQLKTCATKNSPNFLLFKSVQFNKETDEWLTNNGYKTIFDKVGCSRWRLIQSPAYLSSGQHSL